MSRGQSHSGSQPGASLSSIEITGIPTGRGRSSRHDPRDRSRAAWGCSGRVAHRIGRHAPRGTLRVSRGGPSGGGVGSVAQRAGAGRTPARTGLIDDGRDGGQLVSFPDPDGRVWVVSFDQMSRTTCRVAADRAMASRSRTVSRAWSAGQHSGPWPLRAATKSPSMVRVRRAGARGPPAGRTRPVPPPGSDRWREAGRARRNTR